MAQTPEGALKIAAKKAGLDIVEYLARRASGLKRCTVCKQWRAVSEFSADASRYDGLAAKGYCCTRLKVRIDTKGRQSTFKGRTHSIEAKERMSVSAKERPSNRIGKTHSAETKKKSVKSCVNVLCAVRTDLAISMAKELNDAANDRVIAPNDGGMTLCRATDGCASIAVMSAEAILKHTIEGNGPVTQICALISTTASRFAMVVIGLLIHIMVACQV